MNPIFFFLGGVTLVGFSLAAARNASPFSRAGARATYERRQTLKHLSAILLVTALLSLGIALLALTNSSYP
jgi:hypothetical protein